MRLRSVAGVVMAQRSPKPGKTGPPGEAGLQAYACLWGLQQLAPFANVLLGIKAGAIDQRLLIIMMMMMMMMRMLMLISIRILPTILNFTNITLLLLMLTGL